MTTVTDGARIRAVPGELNYLAPESTVLRRFTAPGASVNTGTYRSYVMPIHDGRAIRDQFTLDPNGFEIIEHPTAARDFTDHRAGPLSTADHIGTRPAPVRSRASAMYVAGASAGTDDVVVTFEWVARTRVERNPRGEHSRPPPRPRARAPRQRQCRLLAAAPHRHSGGRRLVVRARQ